MTRKKENLDAKVHPLPKPQRRLLRLASFPEAFLRGALVTAFQHAPLRPAAHHAKQAQSRNRKASSLLSLLFVFRFFLTVLRLPIVLFVVTFVLILAVLFILFVFFVLWFLFLCLLVFYFIVDQIVERHR